MDRGDLIFSPSQAVIHLPHIRHLTKERREKALLITAHAETFHI